MKKIRLGVNIDHVTTVRNARGEFYPSPLRAALLAQKNGADSVTIHLREDRRHINAQPSVDVRAHAELSDVGLLEVALRSRRRPRGGPSEGQADAHKV